VAGEGEQVPLAADDFRRERALLAPHLFADPGSGDEPPTELVSQDRWEHVIDLPTDVLLRTTSHEGRVFDDLADLSTLWTFITPMEEHQAPFLFEAALLAGEEFDALTAPPPGHPPPPRPAPPPLTAPAHARPAHQHPAHRHRDTPYL
jgi:hypothetical protein